VPEDLLYVLPEEVDYRAGSLTEPLACCVQAVCELTEVAPSDVVLISGPGPIGMICAALAKLRGATVILCGTAQDRGRLEMAGSFGTDRTVDVTAEDAAQVARDMTDGYGADVVLECVGVGASVDQCLDAAARLGRYTQVGLLDHPAQVDFGKVVYKQLRVQGALGQTWSTWEKTLRLLRRGVIDMSRFITHEVPLSRWQEAFDNTEQKRGLKNVLCP
jgi:L-iditol 2-dehydrogenase